MITFEDWVLFFYARVLQVPPEVEGVPKVSHEVNFPVKWFLQVIKCVDQDLVIWYHLSVKKIPVLRVSIPEGFFCAYISMFAHFESCLPSSIRLPYVPYLARDMWILTSLFPLSLRM